MAGDKALSMLIDIRARNSFSGVIGLLASSFSGLMGSLGNLAFGFRNLGTAGTIGMDALKLGAVGLVKSLLQIGAVAALVGAGIAVAFGAMALKSAADFQQEMTKVGSLAAPVTENMKAMGQAILAMAPAVGQGPIELAKALYLVESAGFHGKDALDILTRSSWLATAGMTSVKVVADAVTSAVNAFGKSHLSAATAIDVMTATVSAGKMQVADYARVIGNLASKAAIGKIHVSFQEANAALALFTRSGMSAQLAATRLGALFVYLDTQTVKMADNAHKLGLSFDATRFSTLSLADKVKYLHDITGGNFAEVQKLMGGNKTLATTYQQLYGHTSDYNTILGTLKHSHGAALSAFQKASKDYNTNAKMMDAAFQSLKITVGNALLPVFTQLVQKVTPIVQGFITWETKTHGIENALKSVGGAINTVVNIGAGIINFFKNSQVAMALLQGVLITAALFIAGFLVAAFIAWAIAAGTAAIATLAAIWPFILIGIAIALVVAGIILAVKNWGAITKWFQALWHTVWTAVSSFFVGLWQTIISWVTTQWNNLKNTASSVWHAILTAISNAIQTGKQWIVDKFNAILKWIKDTWNTLVKTATDWGTGIINNLLAGLKAAWQTVVDWFNTALAWLKGLWPGSPVKHGPLKGYETWGFTFGMGIADGIRRSVPHVRAASALLAASMGGNYQGSYSLSGGSFGGGRYPTGGATIVNVFPVVQPNDIYMDGDKLTDKIMRRAGTDVRRHGGPIKWG